MSNIQHIDLSARGFVDSTGACAILGCSRAYLERLVNMGKISTMVFGANKHGRTRFYKRKEVERYKAEHPLLGKNLKRAV